MLSIVVLIVNYYNKVLTRRHNSLMKIYDEDMTLICDALVMMSDEQKYKKRKIDNLLERLDEEKKKKKEQKKNE